MYSICKIDSIEKYIHPAVVHQTLINEARAIASKRGAGEDLL